MEDHAQSGIALLSGRIMAAEIEEAMLLAWQVTAEVFFDFWRQGEEAFKTRVMQPWSGALMQDKGEHDGQRQSVVFEVLVEQRALLEPEAQRHGGLWRGLVLEEDVDNQVMPFGFGGEDEIGVALLQGVADMGGGDFAQAGPVHEGCDRRRQVGLEECGGGGDVGEDGLKVAVVRMVQQLALFRGDHMMWECWRSSWSGQSFFLPRSAFQAMPKPPKTKSSGNQME